MSRTHSGLRLLAIVTIFSTLANAGAHADGPQEGQGKPAEQAQTIQLQTVTVGSVSDSVSSSHESSGDLFSMDSKVTTGFKGTGIKYRFQRLDVIPAGAKVRLITNLDGSAGYHQGAQNFGSDYTAKWSMPCYTDEASGQQFCGFGGDPSGNTTSGAMTLVSGEMKEQWNSSVKGSRAAARGSAGIGALFGGKQCGPYAGGNFSGQLQRTSIHDGGVSTNHLIGAEAEAGLACTGEVIWALTGTAGRASVRDAVGVAHTDSAVDSKGVKLKVNGQRFNATATAELVSDAPTFNNMPLVSPPGTDGSRIAASGTYRLIGNWVVDGGVYYTRSTNKSLPGSLPFGQSQTGNQQVGKGATIGVGIAF